MGLVDHEIVQEVALVQTEQDVSEVLLGGELRRDVEQLERGRVTCQVSQDQLLLLDRYFRVQALGGYVSALELLDLIVDERNERRDHDRDAAMNERRQLKAQALARTGWH